jgi:hypothetical protein
LDKANCLHMGSLRGVHAGANGWLHAAEPITFPSYCVEAQAEFFAATPAHGQSNAQLSSFSEAVPRSAT